MVTIDTIEELDADSLHLVTADTRRECRARSIEVSFQEVIRKAAHGEPRNLAMLEQDGALSRQRNRAMKLVGSTAQRFELLARPVAVGWLGEPPLAER